MIFSQKVVPVSTARGVPSVADPFSGVASPPSLPSSLSPPPPKLLRRPSRGNSVVGVAIHELNHSRPLEEKSFNLEPSGAFHIELLQIPDPRLRDLASIPPQVAGANSRKPGPGLFLSEVELFGVHNSQLQIAI